MQWSVFCRLTSIAVCKNYRIYILIKVFKGLANRSKTIKGWFHGLKIHLIINLEGVLVKASFSSGNKDDRAHFKTMISNIYGKVFGDRGYISKPLFDELMTKGIHLVTRIKKGTEKYTYQFRIN